MSSTVTFCTLIDEINGRGINGTLLIFIMEYKKSLLYILEPKYFMFYYMQYKGCIFNVRNLRIVPTIIMNCMFYEVGICISYFV